VRKPELTLLAWSPVFACWLMLAAVDAAAAPPDAASATAQATTPPTRLLRNPESQDQDDLCFWKHPQHPERSRVITSDKAANRVFVYSLSGDLLQVFEVPQPGNIDVRQSIAWGDEIRDIAVVNQRQGGYRLRVFWIDRQTGALTLAPGTGIPTVPNYGGCLGYEPQQRRLSFLVTIEEDGMMGQYVLSPKAGDSQSVAGQEVRTWPQKKCEGAVADDAGGWFYFAEESNGLFRVAIDPASNSQPEFLVSLNKTGFQPDWEGLTLATWRDDRPAIVISAQGNNQFAVLERQAPWSLLGVFEIPSVGDTDGIDLWQSAAVPGFDGGVFGCHNGLDPAAVMLVPWSSLRLGE
jgi:3-phytase